MMKSKLALLIMLMIIFLISGCKPQTSTVAEELINSPEPETPQPAEGSPVSAEAVENVTSEAEAAPIAEENEPEPKSQIFQPKLRYDGAYNGPLYGTSEQVGSASMDDYFKLLDNNGINYFIGMFGIEGEPQAETLTSDQGLGEIISAAKKHPYRIIPFFNPGIGGEEVEQYLGTTLTSMYTKTLVASKKIVGNDFIKGFGEVETQEWTARHNDPKILQLIDLAQRNDLNFMFHPVASKIDDVKKMIEAYPDRIFLIHMYREDLDKSKSQLIKMLQEHDNLYFSMDAAHIIHVNNMDIIYDLDSANRQKSINDFVSAYDEIRGCDPL